MKTLTGKVVSTKMQKTVVVEIENVRSHPLYKKIMKRHKKIKADIGAFDIKIDDRVKIKERRPMSKEKSFEVIEKIRL